MDDMAAYDQEDVCTEKEEREREKKKKGNSPRWHLMHMPCIMWLRSRNQMIPCVRSLNEVSLYRRPRTSFRQSTERMLRLRFLRFAGSPYFPTRTPWGYLLRQLSLSCVFPAVSSFEVGGAPLRHRLSCLPKGSSICEGATRPSGTRRPALAAYSGSKKGKYDM